MNWKSVGLNAIGAAVLAVVMLSYIHSFVYTRVEAARLEDNVSSNRNRVDTLMLEVGRISGKLDTIISYSKRDKN